MRSSTRDAETCALELVSFSELVCPASSRALDAARANGRRRERPSPSCFVRVDVDATGGTTARHLVAAAARAGARRGAASWHPARGATTDAARISLDATARPSLCPPAIHSAASTKKRRKRDPKDRDFRRGSNVEGNPATTRESWRTNFHRVAA
jgi:hypothetical protein